MGTGPSAFQEKAKGHFWKVPPGKGGRVLSPWFLEALGRELMVFRSADGKDTRNCAGVKQTHSECSRGVLGIQTQIARG